MTFILQFVLLPRSANFRLRCSLQCEIMVFFWLLVSTLAPQDRLHCARIPHSVHIFACTVSKGKHTEHSSHTLIASYLGTDDTAKQLKWESSTFESFASNWTKKKKVLLCKVCNVLHTETLVVTLAVTAVQCFKQRPHPFIRPKAFIPGL